MAPMLITGHSTLRLGQTLHAFRMESTSLWQSEPDYNTHHRYIYYAGTITIHIIDIYTMLVRHLPDVSFSTISFSLDQLRRHVIWSTSHGMCGRLWNDPMKAFRGPKVGQLDIAIMVSQDVCTCISMVSTCVSLWVRCKINQTAALMMITCYQTAPLRRITCKTTFSTTNDDHMLSNCSTNKNYLWDDFQHH